MRGPQRLRFLVEEGAGHHEKAWAWRLSGALTFLLSPWWGEVYDCQACDLAERRGAAGQLCTARCARCP